MKWGITSEDFQTSEGRALFQHLLAYFNMPETRGAILGPNALRQVYPTFQLVDDGSMTIESLCHEVRKNRCKVELRETLARAAELNEADPLQALNAILERSTYLQRLNGGRTTDVFAADALERIIRTYELKEAGHNMSICSWPWEPLQEESGGVEKDDYVVIYGRPKSMKSWVLAYLVAHAYEQGKRVLIYTKEMTADNIYMRISACLACVRYREYRKAKLTPYEKSQIYAIWHYLRAMQPIQPMVVLSGKDAGDGGDTVPWLRSKIEEHQPDICVIDGMYLMSDVKGSRKQKDNFRVQNISRDIRQTVLDTGVPVFATIQANRDAAKNKEANLDEISFSDAIGQDATLAMRVINEKHVPTLALMIGGSREFELDGFRIHGVPATNFGYAGDISIDELLNAERADTGGSAKGVKKAGRGKTPEDQTAEQIQRAFPIPQKV